MTKSRINFLETIVFELKTTTFEKRYILTDEIKSDIFKIVNTLRATWIALERECCNNIINKFSDDEKCNREKLDLILNDLCEIYKLIE